MSAVLRAEAMTVRHGGLVALDGVDLEVPDGTVVGLIGPNGAGKTTFIDAVTGYVRPDEGRVMLDDLDITGLAPHRRVRTGLCRSFQSGELFDDLTVRDQLTLVTLVPTWRSTLGDFLRLRPPSEDVEPTLERVGIAGLADRVPADLSHGERQLVALARAIVTGPRVVVLDEPAAGLGPAETAALAGILRGLPATGTSVLLVDHDMSLVMSTCDRIDVMDVGRIIASGTPDEVRADALVRDAYLGGGS